MGRQDKIDTKGNPVLLDEFNEGTEQYTYAKNKREAYAMIHIGQDKVTYFVKVNPHNGRLIDCANPNKVYSTGEIALKKAGNQWQIVNEKTFDFYITYLKTKNNLYLNFAQREI